MLTTLPDEEIGCLDVLKRFLPQDNIIEISEMTEESSKEILDTMLEREGRCLTSNQMELVMNGSRQAQTPLYLKVSAARLILHHKGSVKEMLDTRW